MTAQNAQLVNLSVRANAGSGTRTLTGGFAVEGDGSKTILVRAIGPSLGAFGVPRTLPAPVINLYKGNVVIGSNASWGGGDALKQEFSSVGAFALPANSHDAALVSEVDPGTFSATVTDSTNSEGVALLELYDTAPGAAERLTNVSARADVDGDPAGLTAGFVIKGSGFESVLVRGGGPSLSKFGVSGALQHPVLTLFDANGNVITSNTGWTSAPTLPVGTWSGKAFVSSATGAVFSQVGAYPYSSGAADSAVLVDLPSGNYSAQLHGVSETSGVGLIEVYEVPTVRISSLGASPGQTIHISLTGARFSVGAKTVVTFEAADGARVSATPSAVTPNAMDVTAPFWLDQKSGQLTQARLSIAVIQDGAQIGQSITNFSLGAPNPTGISPGEVTISVLQGFQSVLSSAIDTWQEIATRSKGKVDGARATANLTSLRNQLAAKIALIRRVQSGETMTLLSVSNSNVPYSDNTMRAEDEVWAAYILNSGVDAVLPEIKVRSAPRPRVVGGDLLTQIASYFQACKAASVVYSQFDKTDVAIIAVSSILLLSETPAVVAVGGIALLADFAINAVAGAHALAVNAVANEALTPGETSEAIDQSLESSVDDSRSEEASALENIVRLSTSDWGTASSATESAVSAIDSSLNVRDGDSLGSQVVTAESDIQDGLVAVGIRAVSPINATGAQTIILTGSGFGNNAPFSGDSPYLKVLDQTAVWSASNTGALSDNTTNTVTVSVSTWNDGKIAINGFSGAYGNPFRLASGDHVIITIVNPSTGARYVSPVIVVN